MSGTSTRRTAAISDECSTISERPQSRVLSKARRKWILTPLWISFRLRLHIVKQRYSCFPATGLADILRKSRVDTIVVTGFMTNYCCETTAREAHDMDFFVDFIMDATGCPDLSEDVTQEKIKSVVAASLQGGFARVRTTDQFLEDVF